MNTLPQPTTQSVIAAAKMAQEGAIESAEWNLADDWNDAEVGRRYIEMLKSVTFWAKDDHTVVASVMCAVRRDADIWGGAAYDLLDNAMSHFADVDAKGETNSSVVHTMSW